MEVVVGRRNEKRQPPPQHLFAIREGNFFKLLYRRGSNEAGEGFFLSAETYLDPLPNIYDGDFLRG